MTGLFRFKGDNSPWTILSLLGLGLLALSRSQVFSTQQPSNTFQSKIPETNSPSVEYSPFNQADDLFRNAERSTRGLRSSHHWPAMSPKQIEQARSTLIREGFSPIQADTILPVTPTTP